MTHDMWLAVIGVAALAVLGAIVIGLYAVRQGYTLAVRPVPKPKGAPAEQGSAP